MDWKGFISLDGWIKWNQFSGKKKFWLSCLFIILVPIAFVVYLVRRVNAFLLLRKQKKPVLPYRKRRPALAIATGFFVFIIVLAGSSGNASSGGAPAPAPTQHAAPIQKPTPKPIATPTPIPSPKPTPTPTAVPTQPPVQQQPTQQPAPPPPVQQPPPPPPPVTGVNGNPWGYDFNPGNYITDPPSAFCSYFNCIASFWNGKGHVEECQDATYSKSGGISGSCSKHGGDWRALYSH